MAEKQKADISAFLDAEEKKLTVSLPSSVHRDLKVTASSNGTTIKDLLLEAYANYIVPTYHKEIK